MQLSLWSSSSSAVRANRSRSPGSDWDWMIRAATWRWSPFALLSECGPAGWFSRTSPAYSVLSQAANTRSVSFEKVMSEDGAMVKKTVTSPPSSPDFANAGILAAGECLTLNLPEFHSAAAVSSLSDILETGDLPRRFYLSPKACAGILRRAERRGKELPTALRRALET